MCLEATAATSFKKVDWNRSWTLLRTFNYKYDIDKILGILYVYTFKVILSQQMYKYT